MGWREEECNKAGKEETQMRDSAMFIVPKQRPKVPKPSQKQQVTASRKILAQ